MLDFVHTGSYSLNVALPQGPPPTYATRAKEWSAREKLLVHVRAFGIAVFYAVEGMEEYAAASFIKVLEHQWPPDPAERSAVEFPADVVEELYGGPSGGLGTQMRTATLNAVLRHTNIVHPSFLEQVGAKDALALADFHKDCFRRLHAELMRSKEETASLRVQLNREVLRTQQAQYRATRQARAT